MGGMNRLVILFLAMSLSAVVACKKKEATGDKPAGDLPAGDKPAGDKPADKPPAEVKMAPLDLSGVGDDWKGWSVDAPEGATVKESFGAAEIVASDTWQLDLRLDKADVAGFKKDVEGNDVNKVKRFLLDTPEVILYESEVMGQNEFHLYGAVKSGDVDVTCEDVKGPRHMQAEVEAMWKTCQSIVKK
jgi:hypothetical protein